MNQRYIDFVPAKKDATKTSVGAASRTRPATDVKTVNRVTEVATNVEPRGAMVTRTTVTRTTMTGVSASARPATRPVARPAMRPVTRTAAPRQKVARTPRVAPQKAVPMTPPVVHKAPTGKVPALGVVEDLNTHFVKTDVPKRPLSQKPSAPSATDAKKQKVKARMVKPAAKRTAKAAVVKQTPVKVAEKPSENSTYRTPKSPFINQHKVAKRPLSGNVYKKKTTPVPKEEPKGPVTIIAKPEKEKHIGVIVTIIITIILGAAAGTVAFLLLPK